MEKMIPTRRGRMAAIGDWRQQYQALQMTAAQAAALIESGSVVAFTSSANWPYGVDKALTARLRDIGGHIEADSLFAPLDTALLAAENADLVDYHANFFSGERLLAPHGNIRFVPTPSQRHRRLDGVPPSPGGGDRLRSAG